MADNTQFPASVFKAYDIRGTVPDLIDARFARSLGVALAALAPVSYTHLTLPTILLV